MRAKTFPQHLKSFSKGLKSWQSVALGMLGLLTGLLGGCGTDDPRQYMARTWVLTQMETGGMPLPARESAIIENREYLLVLEPDGRMFRVLVGDTITRSRWTLDDQTETLFIYGAGSSWNGYELLTLSADSLVYRMWVPTGPRDFAPNVLRFVPATDAELQLRQQPTAQPTPME